MSRMMVAAVVASLALPVLGLAAMIGEQEQRWAGAAIVNVPLRGYDPRDLLGGHYIAARLDWDWAGAPAPADGESAFEGGVCVLPGDAPRPRVRFLPGWTAAAPAEPGCRAIIAGEGWFGGGRAARFAPASLDDGNGGLKVFVPETRALDLEETLRQRPGALTVDLAVRPDGAAAIRAVRVDGKVLGR